MHIMLLVIIKLPHRPGSQQGPRSPDAVPTEPVRWEGSQAARPTL